MTQVLVARSMHFAHETFSLKKIHDTASEHKAKVGKLWRCINKNSEKALIYGAF